MSARILIIEDEPGLVAALSDLLAAEGHHVDSAQDGSTGLRKALEGSYDLIVLEVMLPGKNGFDVCRELRRQGRETAVLMLTARGQVTDRVVGLKLGADDYLAKPFDPSELTARIEALLRRAARRTFGPLSRFEFGDVNVDFDHGMVIKGGKPVSLAGMELQLLRYLLSRRAPRPNGFARAAARSRVGVFGRRHLAHRRCAYCLVAAEAGGYTPVAEMDPDGSRLGLSLHALIRVQIPRCPVSPCARAREAFHTPPPPVLAQGLRRLPLPLEAAGAMSG